MAMGGILSLATWKTVIRLMKTQDKPYNQLVVRDKQVISDAYLRFALRMVCQQRRIEELKRLCGVKWMGEMITIGRAGDVLVTLATGSGEVDITQDDDLIVLSLTDAIYLAVLLDEAIALAKGEGAKLDKGSAWGCPTRTG
jgi:hypothetical protein